MNRIFYAVLIFAFALATQTAHAAVDGSSQLMRLAENGRTSYVIALASDAIPAEKTAAQQLQKYLQEVTGAAFPIKSETEASATAPQILVGAGARAKVLLPQQKWDALGRDGIVVKTIGDTLVLAGGRPRGTLYAVFQFLEEEAGCRWWTPTESTIPRRSTLDVPPQNITYVPPFRYREHFTTVMRENPIFATILRENGHYQTQTPDWGGHYNILGFVHTFSKLLPPEKYFAQHPEWYSDPANGNLPCTAASKMPAAQQTQLCLSNPQVLEELTKQALAWIEKNPDAGYISISQNDNWNYCRDEPSLKLAEAEGSQSAPLLDFVNKVAARIHEKYPDFKVETLAYFYSEKPPKTIRPAKNVIIRLAPLGADFGHPLNSDWNADVRDNLREWAKIAPELFLWSYVTNFNYTLFPHPQWNGFAEDLRFFAANHVTGVFQEGDVYTNGVGDFAPLRVWLLGKLMWNPSLDQSQLTDEFLRGYYGAAAPYLKQYLQIVEASFLAEKRKLSASNKVFSFFTLDVTNQAIRLFEQAAAAVQHDEILSARLRRARLTLELVTLYRYEALKRDAAIAGQKFLGPEDPAAAMQDFIQTTQSLKVPSWSLGTSFEKQLPVLRNMFAPPAPLPEFARAYPPADVIDIQQGKFALYRMGSLSDIVDDPAASDQKAATMIGDTNDWVIQARLDQVLSTNENWRIYALVRLDVKAGATPKSTAFRYGIYDDTKRAAITSSAVPATGLTGSTYQRVDLGVHPLNPGAFIWFAGMNDPAVNNLYVDRIILIREK